MWMFLEVQSIKRAALQKQVCEYESFAIFDLKIEIQKFCREGDNCH